MAGSSWCLGPADLAAQVPFSFSLEPNIGWSLDTYGATYSNSGGLGLEVAVHPSARITLGVSARENRMRCLAPSCGEDVVLAARVGSGFVRASLFPEAGLDPWVAMGLNISTLSQTGLDAQGEDMHWSATARASLEVAAGVGFQVRDGVKLSPFIRVASMHSRLQVPLKRPGQVANFDDTLGESARDRFELSMWHITIGLRVSLGPLGKFTGRRRLS